MPWNTIPTVECIYDFKEYSVIAITNTSAKIKAPNILLYFLSNSLLAFLNDWISISNKMMILKILLAGDKQINVWK